MLLVRTMKPEKKSELLGVRLPATLLSALEKAASAQLSKPQELLRRAAQAIIECYHVHGSVPADMEIVQAQYAARMEEAPGRYTAAMAETPVDVTARDVAEKLMAEVRAHPLFRDKHVKPYFVPALRRALLDALARP